MKNYIKPEFMLASLGVTALAGTNCSIQQGDRVIIESMLEEFGDGIFMESEGCQTPMDGIVEGYCKFTAGDHEQTQIFFS